MSQTKRFPWYDSPWLSSYVEAKRFLAKHYPDRLEAFVRSFDVLRTDLGFQVQELDDLFTPQIHQKLIELVQSLKKGEFEKHEFVSFGRLVIHNHEYLTLLQKEISDLVSERVQEEVEPSYNFLSLYNDFGVCDVHLDSPSAKWTVDYCIEQSGPWPIHFSQPQSWPEDWTYASSDWQDVVKNDPNNRFESFVLQPNQAIVFSGSSQWHYRDPMKIVTKKNFCHLLFFHYIPKGSLPLTRPLLWAKHFGIPELDEVVLVKKSRNLRPKKLFN